MTFFSSLLISFLTFWGFPTTAFFNGSMIPNTYHGTWVIPSRSDSKIWIETDRVTASFRSAELFLQPKTIHPHQWELYRPTITKRPSTYDIREIWKGIRYLRAIEEHGVQINISLASNGCELFATWKIRDSMTGTVHLVRDNEEKNRKNQ